MKDATLYASERENGMKLTRTEFLSLFNPEDISWMTIAVGVSVFTDRHFADKAGVRNEKVIEHRGMHRARARKRLGRPRGSFRRRCSLAGEDVIRGARAAFTRKNGHLTARRRVHVTRKLFRVISRH